MVRYKDYAWLEHEPVRWNVQLCGEEELSWVLLGDGGLGKTQGGDSAIRRYPCVASGFREAPSPASSRPVVIASRVPPLNVWQTLNLNVQDHDQWLGFTIQLRYVPTYP